MNITKSKTAVALAVGLLALSVTPLAAIAVPITGGIGFGGVFTTQGGNGLEDATGINIGYSVVTRALGDYEPTWGEVATFAPVNFLSTTPLLPLWQVQAGGVTYAFNLFDLSVDFQSATTINLSGNGVLSIDAVGYDDTAGNWTFSGNQAGQLLFTFSSVTAAAAVPEPATLLLLGMGVLGLAAARRRRA